MTNRLSSLSGLDAATGTFVAVVGPSGVGKDSVIAYARSHMPDEKITIVRRVVTRSADASSEDHDSLTPDAFDAAERQGHFALSWAAHGLRYGLPVSLDADLVAGRVVIANLSRAVIPALMARYPNALVVEITAERDVIARRLALRGRESADSLVSRLNRAVPAMLPPSTIQIDNSGDLAEAGGQFVQLLEDIAGRRSEGQKDEATRA